MKRLLLPLICCSLFGQTLDYSHWHRGGYLAAMDQLATTYPSLVRVVDIQPGAATTFGGRRIRALKISSTPDIEDPSKGDAVFVGAHHAREWMSVETVLYIADKLLHSRATDPALAAELDRLQVWIIPVLNPDGFDFTLTPANRLWRKNRQPNGDGTFGVDPNRNYGFQFGLTGIDADGRDIRVDTVNTSSDSYTGASAFSTAESSALRDFLQARQNLRFLVTYHAYSSLWLHPWSYTGADPPGELFLKAIADRSRALIQGVHGIPAGDDITYHVSGEATDFIWNTLRIAAFTPEVRPHDCLYWFPSSSCSTVPGQVGTFAPPESEILPNNQEQFPAARALIRDAAQTRVWIKDHPDDDGAEPSARIDASGHWTRAFWESPDIRTNPAVLNGGDTVRLLVHVRNATGATQSNVRVRAYYTDPRVALEFPSPTSILIGETITSVPAGGADVEFPWLIPNTLNSWGEAHWCVGVVVLHQDDMPLSSQIQKTSNIGGKNFQTVVTASSSMLLVAADNDAGVAAELQIVADDELIRQGWRIEPVLGELVRFKSEATRRKARLLDVQGAVLEAGQSAVVPVRLIAPPGTPVGTEVSVRLHGVLRPLVAGQRPVLGNGFTYRVRIGATP